MILVNLIIHINFPFYFGLSKLFAFDVMAEGLDPMAMIFRMIMKIVVNVKQFRRYRSKNICL